MGGIQGASDAEILATADATLCVRPGLQVAYDRMMAGGSETGSDQYNAEWYAYIAAGGDKSCTDGGIDRANYIRWSAR